MAENDKKTGDSDAVSGSSSEESGISQVDLKQYEFSPPGPMGWTAKEYEKIIEKLQREKKEGRIDD